MSKFASPRLRGRVVGLCLTLGLSAGIGYAAEPVQAVKVVPDLLELPAVQGGRAVASMQLAVTSAGKRLVSVGEGGLILLSDDGGRGWRQAATVPVSVALTDVSFADPSHGWAVGHSGVILATADGGENWTLQLDGTKAAALMVDEAEALAKAGDAKSERALRIAKSMQADGPDKPLLAVRFSDARHGMAVGAYGLAMQTDDGGRNWRSIATRLPNPAGKHLYRIVAGTAGPVIVGEQGTLIASGDGGATYEALETPYEGSFFSAVGTQDGGLLAVGLKGNVWRGDATLERWQQIPLAQPVTVTAALRLADGMTVLTDEIGRVLISRDDGRSFTAAGNGVGAAATGAVQADDGALVVSTARGNRRFDLKTQILTQEAR